MLASYSIAFLHYLRQRTHGQGLICLATALVKEWMHSGIRQSSQCTVKCGAAPLTWRNNSDHYPKLNQTNMTSQIGLPCTEHKRALRPGKAAQSISYMIMQCTYAITSSPYTVTHFSLQRHEDENYVEILSPTQ